MPITHEDKRCTSGHVLIMLLLLLYIFTSCKGRPESFNPEDYSYGVVPEKGDRISLPIDDETRDFTLNVRQLETSDGKEFLLHLNELNHSIGIYDLQTQQKVRHVYYEIYGPNGAGNVDGFDIPNEDTLMLLSRYEHRLSLAAISEESDTLQLVESYKLRSPNIRLETTPYTSVRAPIIARNDSLFMASVPYVDPKRSNMYQAGANLIGLSRDSYHFNYQNLYTAQYNAPWTIQYSRISICYNPSEEVLVYSLPIADSIYSIDKAGIKKAYHAKPSYFTKTIKSYTGDFDNDQQAREHFLYQPSYGYILYDKYRDYYYRFTENVATKAMQKYGTQAIIRRLGVMVLNNNFEVIGEKELITLGSFPVFVVGKKGLYMMLGSSDESKMKFDLYEFPGD